MTGQPVPFTYPTVGDLYRSGKYLRSKIDDRYVIYRGVCYGPVAKLPPFLPFKEMADIERFSSLLDLLYACGFYTLRLPFSWAAFEPACDPETPQYDEEYFDQFFAMVGALEKRGFSIFLDVHQDLVQEAFGGNGFPIWVLEDGVKTGILLNNTPWWGLNYVMNKGLRRTFTQFWKNDLTNTRISPPLQHFPVLDRYLLVIERIAERANDHPYLFGFEFINEPHPALLGEELFERELLSEFYRDAIEKVRACNRDLLLFLAPQSDWNVNLRRDKEYRSLIDVGEIDDRLVFAFHYYDSWLTGLHGLYFNEMKREEYIDAAKRGVIQAEEKAMVPFLTEFGSRQNWFSSVTKRHMNWQFEAVERAMLHATYWNVNFYNTEKEKDGFMREDFSLIDHEGRTRNLALAVRPYVMAASAEPVTMVYNDRLGKLDVLLRGEALPSTTVLYIPACKTHELLPVAFENGFEVRYNGNGSVTFDKASNQLHVQLDPTITEHHLTVDRAMADASSGVVFRITEEELASPLL